MGTRQWVYVGNNSRKGPSPLEKAAVADTCERFVADVLKPRFLPEIRVTEFNYPVDIGGKWHGRNYRFFQRYRSNGIHTEEGEFESPFVRLEYLGRGRFDISYFRHTGKWWRLYRSVSLSEALHLVEEDGLLPPL